MLLTFLHIIPSLFSAPDDLSVSDDMIPGTVRSIKVSGVYGQGDYDFSTRKWKYGATSTYVIEPKDARVKVGEITPLTNKTSALMMIPQTFDANANANAKVSMVFNDGAKDKTVSFSLNGTSWDAGNHITYVLSSSKITTLKMGKLTYPSGWDSVNDGATSKIRTEYDDPNTSAGLFVVNEEKKVIAANVKLTLSGTSWSLPAGSKLKFSPKYCYFVYYPYHSVLPGAPAKDIPNIDVTSAENFFANAIDTWKKSKIATDQSTLDKMNACDLQIGNASLDEDGCSVSFAMKHTMGLAEITLGAKTFDNNYYLSNYPSYTWKNGTTTFHAYAGISGHSLYKVADYRYVAVVKPGITTDFSCSSTTTEPDSWTGNVSIKPAANGVDRVTATSKRTSWPAKSYTMDVGDIYYNNGGITKPTIDEIAAARKNGLTTIGIIGYLGNDYWTESNTGSGYGGHALVMCLKTVGSEGRFSLGIGKQWYPQNIFVGNISDCYIDSHAKILASKNNLLGSGYYLTKDLQSFPNAYAAQAVNEYNKTILPKSTGWFLPSAGQVYALISSLGGVTQWESDEFWSFFIHNNSHEVTQRIDDFLSKVGESSYTDFFCNNNTCNWTSSQYSSSDALLIDSGIDDNGWYKSIRISPYGKDHVLPIRLFLAF